MYRTAAIIVSAVVGLGTAPVAHATPPPGGPIPLDDVDTVSIAGVGVAIVAIGSPAELTVRGPAGVVDQFDVTVDDEELVVGPAANSAIDLGPDEALEYDITVEQLDDIEMSGAVTMRVAGVAGGELGVEVRDTASVAIDDVDLEDLDAEVRGTATLVVTGSTDELELDASDAAAFDGTALAAGAADVEARDSARVVVNVSGRLEAEVRGTAIVEHVGMPAETELDVRDAGQVREATGTLLPAMSTPAAASIEPGAVPTEPDSAGATTIADVDGASASTVREVSLAGRAFSPAALEVSVGDTVTWINDDDSEHTVTANAGAFDSGALAEGATFSYTFDTAGEFAYRCLFHDSMQGTVVVR